jgi:uncharacterized repeat protein (TIGR01451 family)
MTTDFTKPKTRNIQLQERIMNDNSGARRSLSGVKFSTGPLALMLLMAGSLTAYAAVTNTVTVKGTGPSGPVDGVEASADESVDVADDAPAIVVVRSYTLTFDANSDGKADAGDVIVYSYAVHNSGNVTLTDVRVSDVHDAVVAPLTSITPTLVFDDNFIPGAQQQNDSSDNGLLNDGDWDILGPDDYITFTSAPYTVTPGDILLTSSLDGNIGGTVTASGDYDPGSAPVTVDDTGDAAVPVNIVPSLQVSKVASPDTNVPAGTTVTYTYTVKNTGPVPIINIDLADAHLGSGPAPDPRNEALLADTGTTNDSSDGTPNDGVWSVLAPGDEIIMTGTYIVTQSDVDTLQ